MLLAPRNHQGTTILERRLRTYPATALLEFKFKVTLCLLTIDNQASVWCFSHSDFVPRGQPAVFDDIDFCLFVLWRETPPTQCSRNSEITRDGLLCPGISGMLGRMQAGGPGKILQPSWEGCCNQELSSPSIIWAEMEKPTSGPVRDASILLKKVEF